MSPPQVGGTLGQVVFGIFLIMFVMGIVSRVVASNRNEDQYVQQIGRKTGSLLITMGLLGVLLFFFGYERIDFFGGKFWYPVWLLCSVVWAAFILRFVMRDVPHLRQRDVFRKARSKYLPKKNSRRNRR